jgi:putative acetyltransferase
VSHDFIHPFEQVIMSVSPTNSPTFLFRPERVSDIDAIASLISSAFFGMLYAEGDEAELVAELRRAGALFVSLVAELDGVVVGHIAFSPARCSDGTAGWYGLGPLAVLPAHQSAGIGSALLGKGLDAVASLGARGCILVGHPQIYARFGFTSAPGNAPIDEPAEFFMVKLFTGSIPKGPILFHEAFKHVN